MTIDQLETLERIVEKGSFKAAAESLNKTQPSLSVAIKKLEEEFDLQLFDREGYRPKLTPQGMVFYNWAKQTLAAFRELTTVGKELGIKKTEPFLCIVLDPLASFAAIEGVFLETIFGKHPTEVSFRSEIMSGGYRLLLAGEADFAVSTKAGEDENIESLPFEKVHMVPVVAKSLVKGPFNEAWFRQVPQIIVQQMENWKNPQRLDVKGAVTGARRCFVTDHSLKHKMILNGFGWGRLAKNEIATELKKGQLAVISERYAKPFVLDLHVMRLKNKPMGPVAQAVWAQLKKNATKRTRS